MEEIKIAIIVLGSIGFAFAVLLSFLSKKLKVEQDPRVDKILEILPGLNCGACGFSGCRPFAEAVVKECKIFAGCLPGGNEVNEKVTQALGIVGCISTDKQVVVCRCGAKKDEKKISSQYFGPQTCKAAHITGGALDCTYGCLALSDCIQSCPSGSLTLVDKRIEINLDKCTGCGQCCRACPRNLFEIVHFKKDASIHYVGCSNKEKVLGVKEVCSRGCIACGICTRVENSPYYLEDNLSSIDYKKAIDQGPLDEGKNKCPTKCIYKLNA